MFASHRQDRQSLFYFILFVLLLHTGLLFLKLHLHENLNTREKVLKVMLTTESNVKKQIVQSEDSKNKTRQEDAYLSDKDRSFDRQSIAKKVDSFKAADKIQTKAQKKSPKDIKLSDLGASMNNDHPLKKAAQDYSNKKSRDSSQPSQNTEMSSTNDHVEDVPAGDVTHLNTAEFKYYGFYHRVRQRLEQFWGRSLYEKAQQLIKMGRSVASSEELVTSLKITLNHLGEIINIELMGTSGVKELDDAAIESFNEAGPFPNPPKGLVKNGQIVIEWGFVVNT